MDAFQNTVLENQLALLKAQVEILEKLSARNLTLERELKERIRITKTILECLI